MNKFNNQFCQHSLQANSCSICNATEPQLQAIIKQYDHQLLAYKNLMIEQDKKINELATKLAYTELSLQLATAEPEISNEYDSENIKNEYYDELPKKQYLYVYRGREGQTFVETYEKTMKDGFFTYMGKVEVIK
jgi:6-pyruvoyl-tetrahydropterin synthase